jgi:hypothetical protein
MEDALAEFCDKRKCHTKRRRKKNLYVICERKIENYATQVNIEE